jgi:hypothetical protein
MIRHSYLGAARTPRGRPLFGGPTMGEDVKQVEELIAIGGKFFVHGGESYCDTPLDSWKLDPAKGGYVRLRLPDGPEAADTREED